MSYYYYREDSIGPVQCGNPLLSKLRSFYYKHAVIDESEQEAARRVLEKIIEKFEMYTSTSTKYTFGELICQGSSFEGLRVTKPIEFDLLLPIKLDGHTFLKEMKEAPGYYYIYYSGHVWKKVDTDGIQVLSPVKMQHTMQAVVNEAVKFMEKELPRYEIRMRDHGAAKLLNVKCTDVTIDIDLVPAVGYEGNYYVAKRHNQADPYHSPKDPADNKFNHVWRKSYSEQEKKAVDNMDEVHRACLKILKK
ncbi:cyclic GMP-AMP synthase-like receptor 3 [Antedon mediterranea]|uniref:cyclic GMP-AMP synthase-like receptor 3 n=1 Tax=Antedon mediterranea TaxID=105859 RepID=UPI003AF7D9A7